MGTLHCRRRRSPLTEEAKMAKTKNDQGRDKTRSTGWAFTRWKELKSCLSPFRQSSLWFNNRLRLYIFSIHIFNWKSTRLCGCRWARKPTLFMFQMLIMHFRSFSNLAAHQLCSLHVFHSPTSVFRWLDDWGGFYVYSTAIRNSWHASPCTWSTSNIPDNINKYSRSQRNSVWEFSHVYWDINEHQMSALSSGSIAYNSTWKLWHLDYCTDTFFTGNILQLWIIRITMPAFLCLCKQHTVYVVCTLTLAVLVNPTSKSAFLWLILLSCFFCCMKLQHIKLIYEI